jgi:oligoribonuclease (3'-5' exoribonuclease)
MVSHRDDCRYAIIDCETTGLDPEGNHVIEVAWLFVDAYFQQISDPLSFIVSLSDDDYQEAIQQIEESEFLTDMHSTSRLLQDLLAPDVETTPMSEIVEAFVADAKMYGAGLIPFKFAGYSVSFDREFLRFNGWRDLIESDVYGFQMHHRIMDISSVIQFFNGVNIPVPYIENENAHRALDDVIHSMRTLQAMARSVVPAESARA